MGVREAVEQVGRSKASKADKLAERQVGRQHGKQGEREKGRCTVRRLNGKTIGRPAVRLIGRVDQ
eukprot:686532-Pleurochrysis_carterae.AAC.3